MADFGPGYCLTGLTNGFLDDTGLTAPSIYKQFRADPELNWPKALLPICHWGCAIRSCIDCAAPNFRMRIFDPNVHEDGGWSDCFFDECESFECWIEAWAAGVDLWERSYREQGRVTNILFRRHPKPAVTASELK